MFLKILFLLIVLVTVHLRVVLCETLIRPGNGFTYQLTSMKGEWDTVRNECKNLRGDLASVGFRNPDILSQVGCFMEQTVWIGLSDNEGSWSWVDGVQSTENNTAWTVGEPNNSIGNDDCAVMLAGTKFNDMYCWVKFHGICEIPMSDDWVRIDNGYSYQVSQSEASWQVTRSECINKGGDLASVGMRETDSISTLDFLIPNMKEQLNTIWIGLSDTVEEGSWVWVDGVHADVDTAWMAGEPNHFFYEDCAELKVGYQKFNDKSCSHSRYGLCEQLLPEDMKPVNTTVIICENDTLQQRLKCCENDQVLVIVSANYGRKSSKVCPHNSQDKIYLCENCTRKIMEECNCKFNCSLTVSNNFFGRDPCVNFTKYIEVTYFCSNSEECVETMTTTFATTAAVQSTLGEKSSSTDIADATRESLTSPSGEITTESQALTSSSPKADPSTTSSHRYPVETSFPSSSTEISIYVWVGVALGVLLLVATATAYCCWKRLIKVAFFWQNDRKSTGKKKLRNTSLKKPNCFSENSYELGEQAAGNSNLSNTHATISSNVMFEQPFAPVADDDSGIEDLAQPTMTENILYHSYVSSSDGSALNTAAASSTDVYNFADDQLKDDNCMVDNVLYISGDEVMANERVISAIGNGQESEITQPELVDNVLYKSYDC